MNIVWIVPVREITQKELQNHIVSMLTTCFQQDDCPRPHVPCTFSFHTTSNEYCAFYVNDSPYLLEELKEHCTSILHHITGCCMVQINKYQPSQMLLYNVCSIDREKGHIRQLMNEVIRWSFSKPTIESISVDVYVYNSYIAQVISFYLRLGFRFYSMKQYCTVFHFEMKREHEGISSSRSYPSILEHGLQTICYQLSSLYHVEKIQQVHETKKHLQLLLNCTIEQLKKI